MKQLLVLRHAESGWNQGTRDIDRTLSPKGRQDAPLIGRWMLEQQIVPDYIISSPAIRTNETVSLVIEELGLDRGEVHWEDDAYNAHHETLLDILKSIPDTASTVFIVGHNPGVSLLIEMLTGQSVPGYGVTPATLTQLEIDDVELGRGAANLKQVIRPEELY